MFKYKLKCYSMCYVQDKTKITFVLNENKYFVTLCKCILIIFDKRKLDNFTFICSFPEIFNLSCNDNHNQFNLGTSFIFHYFFTENYIHVNRSLLTVVIETECTKNYENMF